MDKSVAIDIINRINRCLDEFNKLLFDCKDNLDDDDIFKLKRAVAKIMNISDLDIIERIVLAHYPELSQFGKNDTSNNE